MEAIARNRPVCARDRPIEGYFATRMAWCAALQFGSMIALGVYVATMTSRLRFHGLRVAGVDIALFGGVAACVMTMVAAAGQCPLTRRW